MLKLPTGRAICYSGYRHGQNPGDQSYPSHEQILEDLLIMQPHWPLLRLYDCSLHGERVLEVIRRESLPFQIMLGAYLGAEMNNFACPWGATYSEEQLAASVAENEAEVGRLIDLARQYDDIVFSVAVGNEATVDWTDHFVPVSRMIDHVRRVKAAVKQPVTFCENYVPWQHKLRDLVAELDFISLHTYPVWEYKHVHEALGYTRDNYHSVAQLYPDKPVLITEAGWATNSNGRGIEPHNTSEDLQTIYLRDLIAWTDAEGITCFVFEAFDEPWKGSPDPMEPEKHWGLFKVDRQPKQVMADWPAAAQPSHPSPSTIATMPATLQVHTTARDQPQRLAHTATLTPVKGTQPPEGDVTVLVNPAQRFQTLLGIGAAITDASAEVFARLAPAAQAELLTAYFDPVRGIGYSLLRTTIHSSDFSSASYTYVADGDAALASFDIAPDRAHRLPMIHAALCAAGGSLTTYASPWSAPGWMKDSGRMLKGGSLLPAMADTWAQYMVKFVQAYEREGVPIWGLTVQNEPLAVQTWESMIYSAEQERDFVRDHLGPALAQAGLADRKLIVWDHNRDLIKQRADVILSDPEAAKYVWGVGFHWYETWAGGEPMHTNVAATQAAWPAINLLLTEAAVEGFDAARLQDWANAERYGRQIIGDFNAGAVGWTDWNMLLDARGGPNHVGNFCFAPVHADTAGQGLVFTPSYAYLGHFSKFVRPGAQRISAVSSRSSLLTTAFAHPDGSLAVVVMNGSDAPIHYRLQIGREEVELTIPARAIQTVTG